MAASKEYLQFILDQLSGLEDITYRYMMGEYILYDRGKIAAYLCDDRLLVKILPSTIALLVEDVDDRAFLEQLFRSMYPELPAPKSKKKPKSHI